MTELNHEAEGVELLKQAAKRGHAGAQCSLSWIYTHGIDVTFTYDQRWVLDPDYLQALDWCQQAIAQNHAGGYYHLGYLYNFGKGVEQNYQQARQCYQKAADQGHEHAQYRLGVLLEKGLGVEPDAERALKYYQQSAMKNYDRALVSAARMCEEGNGVKHDHLQAFYWYEKLVSQDNWYSYKKETSRDYRQSRSHALNKLNYMLECGLGVEKNLEKPYDWYRNTGIFNPSVQTRQRLEALEVCLKVDIKLVLN